MAEKAIQFTYRDYELFPNDGKIHQIVEGEHYVNPSPVPYHQAISRNLLRKLADFVESNNLGEVYDAPIDVVLSDVNVVVPDLVFVSRARSPIIQEKSIVGAPDLIVEILSEGTKRLDTDLKSKVYAKFGVTEYWIVDPKERTVRIYRLRGRRYLCETLLAGEQEITSSLFLGLRIRLRDVFKESLQQERADRDTPG